MLQPSKISRSPLDLQNTDLQSILANTALGRLWQSLSQLLRLPNDLTSFILFLMALSVLCGGLILHVHLSARILRARIDMGEQQALFDAIEQQNSEIVWQINESVSLNKVKLRAASLGYIDMPDHQYISAAQVDLARLSGNQMTEHLGSATNSTAGDSALTTGASLLNNNTQPHIASSSLNAESSNLNTANSGAGFLGAPGLNMASMGQASSPTASSMASPQLTGLESRVSAWRQWIQDQWLLP